MNPVFIFLTLLTLFSPSPTTGNNAAEQTDGKLRIVWNEKSCRFVTGGVYARVKCLSNHRLALVYSAGDGVYFRTKPLQDEQWSGEILVSRDEKNQYNYTNSELIELSNGTLLYTWNARPKSQSGVPYKIMQKESRDKGKTWSGEKDIYVAGNTSAEGCWEPAYLQIPSGELQIYFANEKTTPKGEQNITMFRSFDNGKTWGSEETAVCYRKGFRDGMPVPVCLPENRGIAVAIEDNGICGTFKPVIIHSPLEKSWSGGTIDGENPNRRRALRKDCQLASNIYAGAPYLLVLNTGETVLSFQSGEGRTPSDTHVHSVMQVYIGDRNAENFADKSTPFENIPADAATLWTSLCQIDNNTILAVASISGHPKHNGIWIVTGKIVRK